MFSNRDKTFIMRYPIVRRKFLIASAAAMGGSYLQTAFSRPFSDSESPGRTKKKKSWALLPDYDRNPFLRPVGEPLSSLEMATRPMPGECHGHGHEEKDK